MTPFIKLLALAPAAIAALAATDVPPVVPGKAAAQPPSQVNGAPRRDSDGPPATIELTVTRGAEHESVTLSLAPGNCGENTFSQGNGGWFGARLCRGLTDVIDAEVDAQWVGPAKDDVHLKVRGNALLTATPTILASGHVAGGNVEITVRRR